MKSKHIIKQIFFIACVLSICISFVPGQGVFDKIKDKVKNQVETKTNAETYSHWARFQVRVSWKENGEMKYENRVYYSNINELSVKESQDLKMKDNLIDYFNKGIVEPLKAKGIEVNYYDSDVQIYPRSTPYASRKDAEDQMKDRIDVDKSNEREIYTFIWKFNGDVKDEAVTQPKLVYSAKNN